MAVKDMSTAIRLVKLKALSFSGCCNSDWKDNTFCVENIVRDFWGEVVVFRE